jgi:tripartite-type tricarboxylate transporter receptor subunit TctC
MIAFTGALMRLAWVAVCAFTITAWAQQPFPNKPVRLIIPTAPGGSTDMLARLVGLKLTERWGQQVIADNRAGGNGVIGGEALAKAPPDGYTIMITSSAHIITPLIAPTPYDAINDFAPVAANASSENILVIHPSLPAKDLQQFIRIAKSSPGQLNYATGGVGTLSHLAGVLFGTMTGVKMQQIPYKSGGPAITDLVGGHVQVYFAVPISIMARINSGRVRPIAVTGKTRLSALPSVPTFTEAGLAGFDVRYWYGTLAPAATPKEIVDRLSAELGRILTSAEMREKLQTQGMDPLISTPEELVALMRAETAQYSKIVKSAHIKLEQ